MGMEGFAGQEWMLVRNADIQLTPWTSVQQARTFNGAQIR
jgi:hypothetical protein